MKAVVLDKLEAESNSADQPVVPAMHQVRTLAEVGSSCLVEALRADGGLAV